MPRFLKLFTFSLGLSLLITLLPASLKAQEKSFPQAVIAILDVQYVLFNSKAFKESLTVQFQSKREILQKEFQGLQSDLQTKADALKQQEAILSPEAFQEKLLEFQQERVKAQKFFNERKNALDKAFAESRGEISKAIKAAVVEYAGKNGITLILKIGKGDTNGVYSFLPQMNITKDILEKVDQSITSVEFKFE